jgi:uncharacterized protein YbjT (DUF2867 family)
MDNAKKFFVIGATGKVGGATGCNLVENGCWVKALVRNPTSVNAEKLKRPYIEIIKGDLNDPASYKKHLHNIDGAFALFTFPKGVKREVAQGKIFIDTAREMNVPFILYSSVLGADSGSGIPHWESKNEIEQYLKNSGIPYTIIRPAYFFQNFLIPDIHKRILKGKLVTPVRKDKVQQMISTEDVGKICAHVLMNKEKYISRTFTIAADQMDMQSVAKTFTDVLGKPVSYSQLPALLTRIFIGSDLHTMFKYINNHDVLFVENMDALKKEFPFLTPMKEWISNNKSVFVS